MEGEPNQQPQDPPLTFADLGIPVEQKTTLTIIGTARTCSSLTRWEWAYLLLSIASLCASLGLTIATLAMIETGTSDFTLGLVLLYTTLFCFYYVVHGILKERPNELMVFVASILVVAIYSIVNYAEGIRTDLKLARLILVCVLGTGLVAAGVYFSREYHQSGNLIFRTVGANAHFQSMCRTMFLCSSLLKFDLQLQGSMLILVMTEGTAIGKVEAILLGVGIVVTVVFISLGFLSMRFENKVLAIIFLAMSVSEPAYIFYKFYVAANTKQGVVRTATFICGVFALLVWLSIIICMWFVIKNFGKGLKEKVYYKPEKEPLKDIASYIRYTDDVDELSTDSRKGFYGDDPEEVPPSNTESAASVERR